MRDPKDILINGKQLSEILEIHKKWVLYQEGGERANLYGAHLEGAHLEGAYLERAHLEGANLYGAHLEGAHLEGAYLEGAYLEGAHLEGAYLEGAHLERAHLEGAYLYGAHLEGAHLERAYLEGAYLEGAKNIELASAIVTIVPEGEIIGWKKCKNDVIVKLLIPSDAKRSNATGRKCRAEFAEVLEIFGGTEGISKQSDDFIYRVGEIVRPDKFDDNRWNECSNGIHFFITRIEAEQYN